jgi:hypothetical protein
MKNLSPFSRKVTNMAKFEKFIHFEIKKSSLDAGSEAKLPNFPLSDFTGIVLNPFLVKRL